MKNPSFVHFLSTKIPPIEPEGFKDIIIAKILRVGKNLPENPLNNRVCEEDDHETDTDLYQDSLSLFHFPIISTGSEDEKSSVDTEENGDDTEKEHNISDQILNGSIGSVLTTGNILLYPGSSEIDRRKGLL